MRHRVFCPLRFAAGCLAKHWVSETYSDTTTYHARQWSGASGEGALFPTMSRRSLARRNRVQLLRRCEPASRARVRSVQLIRFEAVRGVKESQSSSEDLPGKRERNQFMSNSCKLSLMGSVWNLARVSFNGGGVTRMSAKRRRR